MGFTALILLFASSSAMAIGVGVYGDFQRGTTSSRTYFNVSSDDIGVSGGLVLDTNVAKNNLFNYRVRLGAGQTWASKKPITRASLIQSFGVSPAPLRGDFARFWFGPRIGLHYINAQMTSSNDMDMMMLMSIASGFPMLFPEEKIFMNAFKADIGLVVAGFNFNFGDRFTLSFELGFDYGFMVGKAKYASSGQKLDASGEGIEGFATMAVLFRINDTFAAKPDGASTTDTGNKIKIDIQE